MLMLPGRMGKIGFRGGKNPVKL